jgi:hypothetical protein
MTTPTIKEKMCTKCKTVKPLTEFVRRQTRSDGRCSHCKECYRKRSAELWWNHRDKALEYARRCYDPQKKRASYERQMADPSKREALRRREVARAKANKDKKPAQAACQKAVKNGFLVRPKACTQCGQASGRIEGHHHDYSKPLDVIWLCVKCHRRMHHGIPFHKSTTKENKS